VANQQLLEVRGTRRRDVCAMRIGVAYARYSHGIGVVDRAVCGKHTEGVAAVYAGGDEESFGGGAEFGEAILTTDSASLTVNPSALLDLSASLPRVKPKGPAARVTARPLAHGVKP
jgi:hypothetical protein